MDEAALGDLSPRLAIGALSRHTGVNVETVRYYERIGLLPLPARSDGGHRMYGTRHLKRLGFIRKARDLGFTIEEIRTLLGLLDERDQPCSEAREIASKRLADVRDKIAALQKMEAVLADLVEQCAHGPALECPLLEALL